MSTSFRSDFSLPSARRGRSVYGGAGGQNVRVSFATGFDQEQSASKFGISENKKAAMQNLNDRLGSYLEKVRALESTNQQLELQIHEWHKRHAPIIRDYSKFEDVIDDLRRKIKDATKDNAVLMLQIDNARLTAEDFRIKYENELAVRMSVEGDIIGLRKVLEELTMSRSDLEVQVEGLKEELVYLKKSHAEETAALKDEINAKSLNVEVESKPQENMLSIMNGIRSQYEGLANKHSKETENWMKGKFDDFNKEVVSKVENFQSFQSEVNELRRTLQGLEIELQAQLSLKAALEGQLTEVESRYHVQMNQLQLMVNGVETELAKVKADIERQARAYQELLDVKNKLEMEISEYRRLMDGDDITSPNAATQVNGSSFFHIP
ncbi:keratin, type I cytoskeletal 19-like isoform X2 [Brachionichthys hirsutus]|uniref:keratin, type I cytoskeletal 19-like isoform X2 n=1 Tax=Brachionichthys hirsutus TaxID=412623 RepID=UPI003604E026